MTLIIPGKAATITYQPLQDAMDFFNAQKPQAKKDNHVFYFPEVDKNKKPISEEKYTRLSDSLDKTLGKLYTLFNKENLEVDSKTLFENGKSNTYLAYEKNQFQEFIDHCFDCNLFRDHGSNIIHINKIFAKLTFNATGLLTISPSSLLKHAMNDLLSESSIARKGSFNHESFSNLIDNLIIEIDKLFTKQGYQPTVEMRDNLVSLIWGINTKLLEVNEIKSLLGTDRESHNFNNPNLIKAAAEGYDEILVKTFYVYNYYPTDAEEAESLKTLSPKMLRAVLGGR